MQLLIRMNIVHFDFDTTDIYMLDFLIDNINSNNFNFKTK